MFLKASVVTILRFPSLYNECWWWPILIIDIKGLRKNMEIPSRDG